MIHLLDLIGTFAFAIYGAYLAEQKGFDLFGIGVTAFIGALGGSTIRELLLNRLPVYFNDAGYLMVILCAIGLAILTFKNFHRLQRSMLMIDAISLVTFALIGAERANEAGLGLLGILFLATISAIGGGIMRDLVLGKVPEVFYQDFYATPAIILGLGYYFLRDSIDQTLVLIALLVAVYLVRVVAIHYKIQLWKPHKENSL